MPTPRSLLLLLAACGGPTCPAGQEFDLEGLCVAVEPTPDPGVDTGSGDTGSADTDTGEADSGESGMADSGDTADTGEEAHQRPREVTSLTLIDTTGWLADGTAWRGLSVAPDDTLWAASSAGLLHLSADGATHRVYTTADGLFANDVRAVLAARDGSLWVGYAGTVDVQGHQFTVAGDGDLTPLRTINYNESSEITAVYRLREQPFGVGTGDVWMGTNEGLCLWDADLDVFAEHAHPTHPHLLTRGVAFTPEADIWGGDEYQLGRWRYSNDGDLNPSADLYETWVPWPVALEVPIEIEDADAAGSTLWLASSLFGLARVDVAEDGGASVTTLYGELAAAGAVRAVDDRSVLVGAPEGLWEVDRALGLFGPLLGAESIAGPVQQIARVEPEGDGTAWVGIPGALVRVELSPAQ